MAHAFDTGLALAQRTQLRRGAVTLLSGLLKSAGGYLQAVVPFGGVVRGYTDDPGIELLYNVFNGRAPAIAVSLGDSQSKPAGIGGFMHRASVDLMIYFYDSHARDMLDGRIEQDVASMANNLADPGLEVIMEHVEELLVGQYPGTHASIKSIVPATCEEVRTELAFSLWMSRFTVQVDRVINPHRTLTQMLTGFRTRVRTSDVASEAPVAPLVELVNAANVPV